MSNPSSSVHTPGETNYTHTTFLTTLTDAFADALKKTTTEQLSVLPKSDRDNIVPEYFVEATRQALRHVLVQQYSPGRLEIICYVRIYIVGQECESVDVHYYFISDIVCGVRNCICIFGNIYSSE
jgi:hypothetical protein